MNPEVGRWLLENAGQATGTENAKHTLGLLRTMQLLRLERRECGSKDRRGAAGDAAETRLVYSALLQKATPLAPPCGHVADA